MTFNARGRAEGVAAALRARIAELDSASPTAHAIVVTQLGRKVAPMALRGVLLRPRLRAARGLLLVGRGVRIRNPQFLTADGNLVVEDYAEIQGRSTEGVVFGDGVSVGSFAMVRPSGYYGREPGVGLRVGDNSNVGAYCYVGCSGGIEIGRNVLMSPRVSLYAEDHNFSRLDVPMKDQGVTRRPIVVEDDCWLASGSIILSGTRVGRGAVVAAGAVVTRDVPPFSIVAGSPARVIGSRREDDRYIGS